MKKGFTLIELLAVIVILSIIGIITIPLIGNIIEESRKKAALISTNGIISEAENKYASGMITGISVTRYDFPEESLSYKGTRPIDGTLIIDKNGNVSITVEINGYCVRKRFSEISPIVIETDDCAIESSELNTENYYYERLLNGADPVLSGNLIPVEIESDGTVRKANRMKKWYSYENKEWANAIILFGEDIYDDGDIIEESAIKQYYVWIPRYRYQLWNVNSEKLYPNGTKIESAINIVFESKNASVSTGGKNGQWLTHPAFTSFNTNGIWVGKYETSYNEETYINQATFLISNPNYKSAIMGTNIIIKPNVRSLTNKTVSQFYTMSREVNSELNSHMMKNSEWGAVAYLTYSNYGKCTNGICEEVYINNVSTGYQNESTSFTGQWQYSGTITGCSASSASAAVNSNSSSCESGYAWNEVNNKASTTGNVTGIYDMNGGNWEYIMAVIVDSNGNPISGRNSYHNSGFNGTFGCPTCDSVISGLTELTTGINFSTDTRYYDLYKYDYDLNTDIWYIYTNGKLGDATKEIAISKTNSSSGNVGLWYTDYAGFPSMTYPWFIRGGCYNNDFNTGIFSFTRDRGHAHSSRSSRVVLAY